MKRLLSVFAAWLVLAAPAFAADAGDPVSAPGRAAGMAAELPGLPNLPGPGQAAQGKRVWRGVTRPSYDAQLSFPVPGRVSDIKVRPGEAVRAGTLLMSLDTDPEDARIALMEAELASDIKTRTLTTRMEQAKLDMQRYRTARARNAATGMELQHAVLQYELSKLALEEEAFRLRQVGRNLEELVAQRERMRIYAPCDAIVEDILVERGMAVDKNNVALHLVGIDPMLVEFNIPVAEADRLAPGDELDVVLANGGRSRGVVTQIARIAVLSNRTLRVRVSVPNPRHHAVGLLVEIPH